MWPVPALGSALPSALRTAPRLPRTRPAPRAATATPHSGDETAFRNLIALCNPELATADLSIDRGVRCWPYTSCSGGAPISAATSTRKPRSPGQANLDVPYRLSAAYRDLFDDAAYARERSAKALPIPGPGALVVRAALLRAMASSPRAAAATQAPAPTSPR